MNVSLLKGKFLILSLSSGYLGSQRLHCNRKQNSHQHYKDKVEETGWATPACDFLWTLIFLFISSKSTFVSHQWSVIGNVTKYFNYFILNKFAGVSFFLFCFLFELLNKRSIYQLLWPFPCCYEKCIPRFENFYLFWWFLFKILKFENLVLPWTGDVVSLLPTFSLMFLPAFSIRYPEVGIKFKSSTRNNVKWATDKPHNSGHSARAARWAAQVLFPQHPSLSCPAARRCAMLPPREQRCGVSCGSTELLPGFRSQRWCCKVLARVTPWGCDPPA